MGARLRAIAPLALVIGVLGFLWTEFALNFQFHWVTTDTIPGAGLSVPARFQLIVWLAFLGWGLFFAAGGDSTRPPPGPRPPAMRRVERPATPPH